MSEMKSAWEIAMEKAEKVGKASPEELKQHRQEKYAQIAQSLIEKILAGLDARHWNLELDKYPAEDRALLTGNVILSLAKAIDLEDEEKSRNSLAGLRYLRKGSSPQDFEDRVTELLDEYRQAKSALEKDLEQDVWASLENLGISGSTISNVSP